MKRTSRTVASVLAVLFIIGQLMGCAGNSNSQPAVPESSQSPEAVSSSQPTETAEPITLRYMTWNTTEVTLKGAYERFKKEYEALNPNITIEYVDIPYGNMVQQAFTYASANDLPDLVETATPFIGTFISSDILQPLEGLVDQALLDDIQPVSIQEATYNGKIMAIPRIIIPQVLYYNKSLFKKAGLDPEQPPKTYDDMLTMARKIAKLTTDSGEQIYGLGEGLAQQSNNGLFSMRNFVGYGCKFEMKDKIITVDPKSATDALSYYRTITSEKLCPPGALPKDLRNLFATGRLGMYFDVSNQSATLNALSEKKEKFEDEYAKVTVPVNTNGKSNSTSNTASVCISASSKHPKEAAKFLEWLMSKDAYQIYFDENNTVMTTRKSLASDPLFTEGKDLVVLNAQYPNGLVSLPDATSYMEQFYIELTKAIQAATQTGESLETIVATLNKNIENLD